MPLYIWWVFTRNFDGPMPELSFNDTVQYAVWQHEYVTHDHLQGVVQMKKRTGMKAMCALIGGNPHVEAMRSPTPDRAIAYASKEDSRISGPYYYGEYLARGSQKRSLLDRYTEEPDEMALEDPAKFRRVQAHVLNKEWATTCELGFTYTLSPWQEQVLGLIEQEPNCRDIIWVYGPRGGEGKSEFAKHLGGKEDWLYLPGGATKDLLYMYMEAPTRNLVLDVPRCSEEYINYSSLEQIKNRAIFSSKYEPCSVILKDPVHVVVMANFKPCATGQCPLRGDIRHKCKISGDRIQMVSCIERNMLLLWLTLSLVRRDNAPCVGISGTNVRSLEIGSKWSLVLNV
ncbi:Rep [Pittosporum tobira alphasatellite 3]|nr:Rep [Pittosporum tobira alphasatellite 3]